MYLSKIFMTGMAIAIVAAGSISVSAQPIEPSYELALQVVIGSNDAANKGEIPANLQSISKHLRSSFAFTNYRLAGTFLGRVGNTGNFEYKSTTNILGQESAPSAQPTFLDWAVDNLKSGTTAKGPQGYQAQRFRLGARIPVTVAVNDGGKTSNTIQYESIGLSLARVGLPDNIPTLIGTLNLPGAGGTIFLVVTVRSADM